MYALSHWSAAGLFPSNCLKHSRGCSKLGVESENCATQRLSRSEQPSIHDALGRWACSFESSPFCFWLSEPQSPQDFAGISCLMRLGKPLRRNANLLLLTASMSTLTALDRMHRRQNEGVSRPAAVAKVEVPLRLRRRGRPKPCWLTIRTLSTSRTVTVVAAKVVVPAAVDAAEAGAVAPSAAFPDVAFVVTVAELVLLSLLLQHQLQ